MPLVSWITSATSAAPAAHASRGALVVAAASASRRLQPPFVVKSSVPPATREVVAPALPARTAAAANAIPIVNGGRLMVLPPPHLPRSGCGAGDRGRYRAPRRLGRAAAGAAWAG